MKKIAVYIADQQNARVKALATSLGVTQAEILRRCLEEGLTRMDLEAKQRRQTTTHTEQPETGASHAC
jgi:hypothetical protein